MSDNNVMPEIPENLKKLEAILNKMDEEDRKYLEGHIAMKNNIIMNLRTTNQALLQMISDVFELIQNISNNTATGMKSITRVLAPILTQNQPQK